VDVCAYQLIRRGVEYTTRLKKRPTFDLL